MIVLPRLYAIADRAFGDPVQLARKLFEGGARLVQVRSKDATALQLLNQVEEILCFAPPAASLLVNDRADVALLSKAHGVHLGQEDLPVPAVRRMLGGQAIIGFSTHSIDQAIIANNLPVDYIAFGPIFPTNSKKNPDPVVGLEKLRQVCAAVAKPVVAIGGITFQTAPEVLDAGAASVAVIGDLLRAADLAARTKDWIAL